MKRSVVVLGVARMADAVANSFLIIVLPLYIAAGQAGGAPGLSESAATGIILAAFGILNALVQPFAGRLSDRTGKRKAFVLFGLVALAVFNFMYLFVSGFWALLAVRLGQGASVAFTITAGLALVNELSEPGARGGSMGVYNALRLVGFGAGPLVAGFLVSSGPYGILAWEVDGFEAAFYVATASAAIGALLVTLFVHDPPRTVEDVGELAIAFRKPGGRGLDPIFTLGLATLVMAICIALLAAIEPLVNARLDQDARWFGVQFAAFIFSVAICQPFVGRASDIWGRKRFVVVGMLLLAPTTIAQGLVVTSWQMLWARIAQGVAGAMVFAPALALAGDLARKGQSGAQLSVLTMAFGLGLAGGQLASGFLVDLGFLAPFAAGAALALVVAGLVQREVDEPEVAGV